MSNYRFHCYNAVTITDDKIQPVAMIEITMGYIGSGTLKIACKNRQNIPECRESKRAGAGTRDRECVHVSFPKIT